VAAVGVATVASLEVVGRGEDEVRTFVVEVFRPKLFPGGLRRFFRRIGVEIGWVRHRLLVFLFTPFADYVAGYPPPPHRGYLGRKLLGFNDLRGAGVCKILIISILRTKYLLSISYSLKPRLV
jgi:hypothetical protein